MTLTITSHYGKSSIFIVKPTVILIGGVTNTLMTLSLHCCYDQCYQNAECRYVEWRHAECHSVHLRQRGERYERVCVCVRERERERERKSSCVLGESRSLRF
jgi:hypothetical protein